MSMAPTKDQQIDELHRTCMAHVRTIQRMSVESTATLNNMMVDLMAAREKLGRAIRYLESLAETNRYSGGSYIIKFVKDLKGE